MAEFCPAGTGCADSTLGHRPERRRILSKLDLLVLIGGPTFILEGKYGF
jgi:hypothetical protein